MNILSKDANLSKLELCNLIKKHIPKFEILESDIGQDIDKRDYIVSSQKIYDLGFECMYDLDFGIQQLVKMYKLIERPWYANY